MNNKFQGICIVQLDFETLWTHGGTLTSAMIYYCVHLSSLQPRERLESLMASHDASENGRGKDVYGIIIDACPWASCLAP